MEVIADIESREQALEMFRVAHDLVEVDDRVEVPPSPNPLVHRLPVGLAVRPRMVELRAKVGKDRGADHLDAVGVRARNDLPVGCENVTNEGLVVLLRNL